MKFGSTIIPDSLFDLARREMRSRASFTPEEIRVVLVRDGAQALRTITSIPRNDRIIAERVMRAVVGELRDAGEYRALKRGLWMKTAILDAAEPGERSAVGA